MTLEFLKKYKADAKQTTSLISLISPTTDVQQLRNLIRQEQTTAGNIKSAVNRKSVQIALNNVANKLATIKQIPSEGIAIYAGQYI